MARESPLDEADLAPLVQSAVHRGEDAGAEVTLLLCAGGFQGVTSRGTLVRPFDAAVEVLRTGGIVRIGVVVPIAAQAGPAVRKWLPAGFEPIAIVGDPAIAGLPMGIDAIVLDYVGHSAATVAALRSRTDLPVVDLGECGAAAAVHEIAHHARKQPAGAT